MTAALTSGMYSDFFTRLSTSACLTLQPRLSDFGPLFERERARRRKVGCQQRGLGTGVTLNSVRDVAAHQLIELLFQGAQLIADGQFLRFGLCQSAF